MTRPLETEHVCGCVSSFDAFDGASVRVTCKAHAAFNAHTTLPIKVGYWGHSGYESTAYVNEEPIPGTKIHAGVNKHTDLPVLVTWDEGLSRWQECLALTTR